MHFRSGNIALGSLVVVMGLSHMMNGLAFAGFEISREKGHEITTRLFIDDQPS
jgi:hypothetical protein